MYGRPEGANTRLRRCYLWCEALSHAMSANPPTRLSQINLTMVCGAEKEPRTERSLRFCVFTFLSCIFLVIMSTVTDEEIWEVYGIFTQCSTNQRSLSQDKPKKTQQVPLGKKNSTVSAALFPHPKQNVKNAMLSMLD